MRTLVCSRTVDGRRDGRRKGWETGADRERDTQKETSTITKHHARTPRACLFEYDLASSPEGVKRGPLHRVGSADSRGAAPRSPVSTRPAPCVRARSVSGPAPRRMLGEVSGEVGPLRAPPSTSETHAETPSLPVKGDSACKVLATSSGASADRRMPIMRCIGSISAHILRSPRSKCGHVPC